jgi:predicted O-linked N-acetylglucosamine transferase (SPINDLY family)
MEEAVETYRQAGRLAPSVPEIWNNLANALSALGRRDDALAAVKKALSQRANFPEAHNTLGTLLEAQGKLSQAITTLEKAVKLRPDYVEALNNLGVALRRARRHEDARKTLEKALALKPDHASAHVNLGNTLLQEGRVAEAEDCFRRALDIRPGLNKARSNWLMTLNYRADLSAEEVFEAHKGFEDAHAKALPRPSAYANPREPARRLKVGYVSADYRAHSCAFFMEPLLEAHDREQVEVFCYADVSAPDATTKRLSGLADHWRTIAGVPDATVAGQVQADGIDVLVDLGGHSGENRLLVFARKPAPVQVSWLGYPNTTGLSAMDARLVDADTDPEGALATERLIRLDGGFLAYRPPCAPPLAARPEGRPITFGSFNTLMKLGPAVVALWARLLHRVEGSRLLLKGSQLGEKSVRARYGALFAEHGIDAARLDLLPWVDDVAGHLNTYNMVDVALDPFPYAGTTTTCEALWMGVPVVTLAGDRHAARVGVSLLKRIGHPELIAADQDRYLDMAAALAADPARLAELKQSLRPAMEASPLLDGRRFAAQVEAAYRDLWTGWCAS